MSAQIVLGVVRPVPGQVVGGRGQGPGRVLWSHRQRGGATAPGERELALVRGQHRPVAHQTVQAARLRRVHEGDEVVPRSRWRPTGRGHVHRLDGGRRLVGGLRQVVAQTNHAIRQRRHEPVDVDAADLPRWLGAARGPRRPGAPADPGSWRCRCARRRCRSTGSRRDSMPPGRCATGSGRPRSASAAPGRDSRGPEAIERVPRTRPRRWHEPSRSWPRRGAGPGSSCRCRPCGPRPAPLGPGSNPGSPPSRR